MTVRAPEAGLLVRAARLDLPLLPLALLDALIGDDRAAVAALVPYRVPDAFPREWEGGDLSDLVGFLRLRRDQLVRDPGRYPWSVRAMVLRDEARMIGFVNFHGAPGVNDLGEPDAVELGWSVFPGERSRGYATEAAGALMEWAVDLYGIRHFISATTPVNAASLRVHEKLGFRPTGQVVDGEIVFELRR